MLQTSLLGALPGGTTLGARYRIIRLLGQGGMSRVYLAEDTRLGVVVAVKENLQTSPEARRQFEQEAHLLARLSHPNLPRVSDHFTDPGTGRQYLAMDYVEGEDLKALVERTGALPEQTALAWVGQVLDALEYLHRQQPPVIHRDVKPGNIKITPQGKAVLVDFGIAKVGGPALSTLTGARAVTPGYAPPEQYGMRTTERSDIYALGATLYTMLTGRVPPEAPLRMAGEQLVPPRRVVPAISQPTQTAVLRAMEMETSKRWDSISTFRQALRSQPARPASPSELRRAVPLPAERRKGWLTGITVPIILIVLVALASLAGVAFWPRIVLPKPTLTVAAWLTPGLTMTPVLIATATSTPTVTNTPSPTPVPLTPTLLPPLATPSPPTATPGPSTPTPEPPTPTPEAPTPTAMPAVIVQQDKVNVRKGPSTAYPTVGQVTKGASLDIVGRNAAGDWWQVCCVSGQQVWITGQLVQVQGDTSGVQILSSVPPPPPTATPRPRPTSVQPVAGATQVWEKDGSMMVYVPAGEFTMGSPEGEGDDDEHPQHSVYVSGFWIDQTEVTNEQYRKCVQDEACRAPAAYDWGEPTYSYWSTYSDSSKADHPVVSVSWQDAKAYCEWADKGLPTEAEWEKAARGTDRRKYPWGNSFDGSKLNFCEDAHCGSAHNDSSADDGYQRTAPVGSYAAGASPYGSLDMAGNVWEWCQDWYDGGYYARSPGRDPQGPNSGVLRVVRGGSSSDNEKDTRATNRHWSDIVGRHDNVGFRCVSSAP